MSEPAPHRLEAALREGFLRYYDNDLLAARPDACASERRALLVNDGVVFTSRWSSPFLPYQSTKTIAEACSPVRRQLRRLADVLVHGSLRCRRQLPAAPPPGRGAGASPWRLRTARSATQSSPPGPAPARPSRSCCPSCSLLQEARGARAGPDANLGGTSGEAASGSPARSESQAAAVRAMVLYPTNALVEDQITRLRRAGVRVARFGGEPPLWFGRYTGATLGGRSRSPGALSRRAWSQRVARSYVRWKPIATRMAATRTCGSSPTRVRRAAYRWDMIAHHPTSSSPTTRC